MSKSIAFIVAATAMVVAGCASMGVSENAQSGPPSSQPSGPGVFTGSTGKITGTFGSGSFESPAEREAREATTGASDTDYQAWKAEQERAEYEAWKAAQEEDEFKQWQREKAERERAEFEAWKAEQAAE